MAGGATMEKLSVPPFGSMPRKTIGTDAPCATLVENGRAVGIPGSTTRVTVAVRSPLVLVAVSV